MMEDKLQAVVLKKGDYLVEHLPNYFKKNELGTFSSKVRKAENCYAGIVKVAEEDHPERKEMLVYYQKDVCPVVELLPDIGEYHVVNINYAIMFLKAYPIN